MDPITQGVVGAALAQTRGKTKTLAKAAVIGALAGLAPDLDVLIKSATDPLFSLEFHRHFTHSLFFIPIGALICAAVFYALIGSRWQLNFKAIYLWCLLGYGTHGLLDGCTTYGTQLLWPLTDYRFSWDIISVVDPTFTLPLLVMIFLASRNKTRIYLWGAFAWATLYLGAGYIQHERAIQIGHSIAAERGHKPLRLEAKPSLANISVWKLIYETDERFYVAAIKPGLLEQKIWQGDSIPKLNLGTDFPWLDLSSQQARDIKRFDWFSSGYLGVDPQNPLRIVDIRYSMLPHQIAPLWGIQLSEKSNLEQHVTYFTQREKASARLKELKKMIFE